MPPGSRENILLVDDRPENLVALESALEPLNQNFVRAGSGREALRRLLEEDYAVILLDVQMPEMDGFETASLIRQRERSQRTPIIFLTANNKGDTQINRGYSVGAVDYLLKPLDPDVLRAKVAAFVELARKNRDLQEEIAQRKLAEEEVRTLNRELERRVGERTAELQTANRVLETQVAERQRAEDRIRFLAEASTRLAASLDYQTTLERVVRLAVPAIADFCAVDLLDPEGGLSRLALTHADPSRERSARELWERYPPRPGDPSGLMQVLRTGRAELLPEIPASLLQSLAHDEEHLRALIEQHYASSITVPLVVRGRTLGALTIMTAESGRRYGPEDLILAEDLARRAAAAIDNARLFREVQDAGRRKDEFLAMLAHELRNPLAAICNAGYTLDEMGAEDERAIRLHSIIRHQAAHLSRLVDDLLDMSRITQGKIELRKQPVDLADVIQRAVDTTSSLIEARSHQLTVELPPQAVWLQADPARLEQIFTNLLNNAAKYTEPGGQIWLIARNTEEADGRWIELRVRDTGIGILPELLPRVFDLFSQADRSLDRSQGGLGIGLALVRNLVQMHGGAVSAHSDGPGRGSEFVVCLPALSKTHEEIPDRQPKSTASSQVPSPERSGKRPAAKRPAARTPAREPSPRNASPGRQVRVLIVEDNLDAAETLTEMFEFWGHDVRIARDGPGALSEAHTYRPDVVLLDIGLPGMDGYEVARRLREIERSDAAAHNGRKGSGRRPAAGPMLLVALTGYGQEEDRRLAQEAGFDLHFTKPVDPQELQRLVATVN
jgi:signal transduction histidine kinase